MHVTIKTSNGGATIFEGDTLCDTMGTTTKVRVDTEPLEKMHAVLREMAELRGAFTSTPS